MSKITKVLNDNKAAATSAAIFEAGRIANNKAASLLAKQTPMMMRGYVDTPIGKLVIANMMKMAVEQFKADSPAANRLANGMVVAAYQEFIQSFDIEGIIEGLMGDAKIASQLKKASLADED